MMPTPLERVRERAAQAGLAEAICANCILFRPNGDAMMGACHRTGEIQTRYGVCLSWRLSGEVPKPPPGPSPTVLEDGSISLFAKAERPVEAEEPVGRVDDLACAEPGCGGRLVLRMGFRINRRFYGCERYPACNGTLPANADGSPRGQPRTKEVQGARNQAHAAFDRLWREKHCSRGGAYAWLQEVTGLSKGEAHISMFDVERCREVAVHVETKGPGTAYWDAWRVRYDETKRSKKKRRRVG